MGIIKIALEDENGRIVEQVSRDPHLLDALLPALEDRRFQALRFIDPHGDTVFNRLQMEQFLTEWGEVGKNARNPDASALVSEVARLAAQAKSRPHLYLKFYGD